MKTSFSALIDKNKELGRLIVQPRMGFGTVEQMSQGLLSVKEAHAPTIGSITLDSYTRVNQYQQAKRALDQGYNLNGYPIVTHGARATYEMLSNFVDVDFVVQVRHGTALPSKVFQIIVDSHIDATEGGPISYCLPYSRVPLKKAVEDWRKCCEIFANACWLPSCHIESFAGCMLGQLCPPSLLIALGVLECLFFKKHGINSVSLSYAQGTSSLQDIAALSVLRKLADLYLSDIDWHVVMYTYMGMFPTTVQGSNKIILESARVAAFTNCERLVVKTPAEAHRIPTIQENVASLEIAYLASKELDGFNICFDQVEYEIIFEESQNLIQHVLNLDKDIGWALIKAFHRGILDVPYCLHRENQNSTRCFIDDRGYLQWANYGLMPIKSTQKKHSYNKVSSKSFLAMLTYVRNKYDYS